jgi:uncharacterized protein YdaU (DUF1376 family)
MAKDPAFLFYPGDWLGGTIGMTFEQKGAYMELLILQFNRGHMTSDMAGHMVGRLWDKLQDKFVKDDQGLFYNVRLDEEKNNRKSFTDSRKNNLSGKNQHSKKTGHTTSRMEDENILSSITRNSEKIEEKKKKVSGWLTELKSSEIWLVLFLKTDFPKQKMLRALNDFAIHVVMADEYHPDISLFKKHFTNWLPGWKSKNTDNQPGNSNERNFHSGLTGN